MALVSANLVKETSTTTGTGTWTLAGAVTGFRTWVAVGNGNTGCYSATDGTNWEIGLGTYTSAGTTLARTVIIASSNAGAAVNFTTTVTIANVFPADVLNQRLILSSNYTLVSQTAAQKLFNSSTNGAITLPVGTYRFRCFFAATALSASSGTFGFALGGTKTSTEAWIARSAMLTGLTATGNLAHSNSFNAAASAALTSATASAPAVTAEVNGVLRVTVAGTVIPQVSLTVAAAGVVQAGSFFEIELISPSSTETLIGPNWS